MIADRKMQDLTLRSLAGAPAYVHLMDSWTRNPIISKSTGAMLAIPSDIALLDVPPVIQSVLASLRAYMEASRAHLWRQLIDKLASLPEERRSSLLKEAELQSKVPALPNPFRDATAS